MLSSSGCDLVVFLTARRPDLARHISSRLPTTSLPTNGSQRDPMAGAGRRARFGELEAMALRHALSAVAALG